MRIRHHTTRKEVLHFNNMDLAALRMEEHMAFMTFVDNINFNESDKLSKNQWKKLYAIVRNIAQKTNINYCIYRNPYNVYFDVTVHIMGTKEDIENNAPEEKVHKETEFDRLKRYSIELEQIRLKIEHLKTKEKECIEKIEPLKQEVMKLLEVV